MVGRPGLGRAIRLRSTVVAAVNPPLPSGTIDARRTTVRRRWLGDAAIGRVQPTTKVSLSRSGSDEEWWAARGLNPGPPD